MKCTVLYLKASQKYLKRLTPSKISTILKRIEKAASNPLASNINIVKLIGTKSSYRLRIGNIRVVYELDTVDKIMYVAKIAPRSSAYSY